MNELQKLLDSPSEFLQSKFGYYVHELRCPIQLQAWEAKLINLILGSRRKVRVIGDIKKNLKTTKAAMIVYYIALRFEMSEIYVISNDFEQSKSRVFSYVCKSVGLNPYVDAQITSNQVTFKNGSAIKALPSDYRGESGSNPRLSVFDEPWGFVSESALRMVEEFTPPPNIPDAFQLFTGYSGFEGESKLWKGIYDEGVKGKRLRGFEGLPVYETDEILMYWSHGPLEGHPGQPWHTKGYFESQRRILRPFQFLRLHKNEWTTGSESFVSKEVWRQCVDETHSPPLPNRSVWLYVGVDCGLKSDNATVMSVYIDYEKRQLALGPYRIWRPSKHDPLDIDATIGAYLRELCRNYGIHAIRYDPWQLHQLGTELRSRGFRIEEFPQTTANLTLATQNLFDLLLQNNIVLPDDPGLEEQCGNAVAVESSRGIRLAKEKSSRKIDAIVALAMACVPAVGDFGLRFGQRAQPDDLTRKLDQEEAKRIMREEAEYQEFYNSSFEDLFTDVY